MTGDEHDHDADDNAKPKASAVATMETAEVDVGAMDWITEDGDTSVHVMDDEWTSEPGAPVAAASMTVLTGTESGRFIFIDDKGATVGRGPEADHRFADQSMSRLHARLERFDDGYLLHDGGSTNGTFVEGMRVEGTIKLPPLCRIQFGARTVLQYTALDDLSSEAVKKVMRSQFVDPLTGTGNRLQLEQRLRQEISFARRHHQPLGVMLVDIDRFREVNARYGAQAGDRVLESVGEILLGAVRAEDVVFRYGGEEFCVLVRGVEDVALFRMAERIQRTIERANFWAYGSTIEITVSIGVSSIVHTEGETNQSIILRAYRALSRAMTQGGNRVEVHEQND